MKTDVTSPSHCPKKQKRSEIVMLASGAIPIENLGKRQSKQVDFFVPSPFFQRTLSTVPLRRVVKAPKENDIDSHFNFLTKIQIQKLREQLEDMTAQRDAAL